MLIVIAIYSIVAITYRKSKNIFVDSIDYQDYINQKATDYLISKSNSIDTENYIAGDKKELYTFLQDTNNETEYRYIGYTPNNYVYFNCDDDSNTDTCEIWRIIGVFEVEDESGNKEKRLKIMKNKSIVKMAFDENEHNETSELYTEGLGSSESSIDEEDEEEEEEEEEEEVFSKTSKESESEHHQESKEEMEDDDNDNDTTFKSIHSYDELSMEHPDTSNNDATSVGGNDAKSVTSFDSYRSGSMVSRNTSNPNSSPKVYPKKVQKKDFSLNTQTLITKLGQNVIDVLEGLEERMRFNVHGSSNNGNTNYQMRRQSSLESPVTSMTVKVSPPDVHIYAPAYDVTPSNLISAIITDKKSTNKK